MLTNSKKANILINDRDEACLADFGLSEVLHGSASLTATSSSRGTLRWMAPELLNNSELDNGTPTFASDVYALAMVFYEVKLLYFYIISAETDHR